MVKTAQPARNFQPSLTIHEQVVETIRCSKIRHKFVELPYLTQTNHNPTYTPMPMQTPGLFRPEPSSLDARRALPGNHDTNSARGLLSDEATDKSGSCTLETENAYDGQRVPLAYHPPHSTSEPEPYTPSKQTVKYIGESTIK